MRFLRRFIRRYPMQSFLILFNTGVFAWIQTTGHLIAERLGLSGDAVWTYIPDWLKTLSQHSLTSLQDLYGSAGVGWLVVSMFVTWALTFLRGLFRMLLMILVIGVGLWLIYRYSNLLSGLTFS